jgi:hypothetical protein
MAAALLWHGRGRPRSRAEHGLRRRTLYRHRARAARARPEHRGRIVDGIEWLSSLPRGTGDLGFYKTPAEYSPIVSARLASDLPAAGRPHFQYRATTNPRFAAWIASRENRTPPFFTVPAGGADICNALPPVRRAP